VVSPTNKTDGHNIIEILLKGALSTITLTQCKAHYYPGAVAGGGAPGVCAPKIDFSHEIPQKDLHLHPLGTIILSTPPYLDKLDPPLLSTCLGKKNCQVVMAW
jgi:hypothetical protein